MAHLTDLSGYPLDPHLRELEFSLGDLAAQWRGSYDSPELQEQIRSEYTATLLKLYELQWDSVLDVESELPDRLMPIEYLKRHGRS
jgi:hypothetical protein